MPPSPLVCVHFFAFSAGWCVHVHQNVRVGVFVNDFEEELVIFGRNVGDGGGVEISWGDWGFVPWPHHLVHVIVEMSAPTILGEGNCSKWCNNIVNGART